MNRSKYINVRNWITMVWFKSCKNVTLSTFLLSQNVLWGKYKISIKWWWNKYLQNNITDECFTFHWYYRNYIMQICMNLGSFIASSLYGWHMKVFRYRIVIDKFTLLLHFKAMLKTTYDSWILSTFSFDICKKEVELNWQRFDNYFRS